VFAVLDPNVTWHVQGHGPRSGDYVGHDAIGDFFRRMELSGGSFSIAVRKVRAQDEIVVALVTVNVQRKGVSASFPELRVWRN
jgi:uncharacterized protein